MNLWLILGLLTFSIFIHELGHLLAYRACGVHVSSFNIGFGPRLLHYTDKRGTVWGLRPILFGGYVEAHAGRFSPLKRMACMLAGPFASMLLACMAFFICTFTHPQWLLWLAFFNASLAVLNLVPLPPLDGGNALFAWLEHKRGKTWVKRRRTAFTLLGLVALLVMSVFPAFITWHVVPRDLVRTRTVVGPHHQMFANMADLRNLALDVAVAIEMAL